MKKVLNKIPKARYVFMQNQATREQKLQTTDKTRVVYVIYSTVFDKSFFTMGPIWKRNPACNAQRLLIKLFEEGKIKKCAKAAAVQTSEPEFLKFSEPVFRGAFNELKAKYGTECKWF